MKRSSAISSPNVSLQQLRKSARLSALCGTPQSKRHLAIAGSTSRSSIASVKEDDKESHIRVYVRCRGRNEREVSENSGTVVTTAGLNGKQIAVHTSYGGSNKLYSFDRVFGPESDQAMVFDEVAVNVLDEMLAGYNCTIFAYGQTGTGKTYTMTGDTDGNPAVKNRPVEKAGIIPRVLHYLFKALDRESGEHSVKVSYIELYNEELRDLIGPEDEHDKNKVKIYDDNSSNKGRSVLIQGMEELFISSAEEGLEVLREGSYKRQVASTKCNDLSSRSHSVFTITIHIKEVTVDGEEHIKVGKLNLVDLAGSENINRSGAENKRAREAGMINQSLLTLGRVINALIEHSPHIPYRESKLTRILQDSLGGRTKTCIIATISPAKVSLDETLSTLDYASRARNIKNKPQMNQTISKQVCIMDYVKEIERLKADLRASRQKNGVFLTSESYNQLTEESESRRILAEEQKLRLNVIEEQLQVYRQEKDNHIKQLTDLETMLDLKDTELISAHEEVRIAEDKLKEAATRLDDEIKLRQAYENTEIRLHEAGERLISTIDSTVDDVQLLHKAITGHERVDDENQAKIKSFKDEVSAATLKVCDSCESCENVLQNNVASVERALKILVDRQEIELKMNKEKIIEMIARYGAEERQLGDQLSHSENQMSLTLDEINGLRQEMVQKLLHDMNNVKEFTEALIHNSVAGMKTFEEHMMNSFKDLKVQVTPLFKHTQQYVDAQNKQISKLKNEISKMLASVSSKIDGNVGVLSRLVNDEKSSMEAEKSKIIESMTELLDTIHSERINSISGRIISATSCLSAVHPELDRIDKRVEWFGKNYKTAGASFTSIVSQDETNIDRALLKLAQQDTEQLSKIINSTENGCEKVATEIASHTSNMDQNMDCLNEFVTKTKQLNKKNYSNVVQTLQGMGQNVVRSTRLVEESEQQQNALLKTSIETVNDGHKQAFTLAMSMTSDMTQALKKLDDYSINAKWSKYESSSATPARTKQYIYSKYLPKTKSGHELLNNGKTAKADKENSEPLTELSLSEVNIVN